VKINIVNKSRHQLPSYATSSAAGMDIRANIDAPISLEVLERKLIKTGIYIQLPDGFEAQIRPRSGLALKQGITILNSPGTIDSDYRGEVGVILVNLSSKKFVVKDGDRIAQMVIARHEKLDWKEVDFLENSTRGSEGFGSTGVE
tara:strand:+ start:313 stop:747 length:435 start_codon:yes stop_codon:yes gene_type:complete